MEKANGIMKRKRPDGRSARRGGCAFSYEEESINWPPLALFPRSQDLTMRGLCILIIASLLASQIFATPDAHFLRSLRSDKDGAISGHFMRALRSSHFLRALRALGSKDLQRILRSDPAVELKPDYEEPEVGFGRSLRTNSDHFLRSLRSSDNADHFLRSLRSAHDFMRMVRSDEHFLRSLKDHEPEVTVVEE